MNTKRRESSKSKILLDQVEDLYNYLSYANWSVIFISSFLVWILWPVANRDYLLLWDAYILLIVLGREDVAIRYHKSIVTEANVNLWLKLYIGGVFLSGIGWGMALIVVVPSNLFIYLVITSFLVGGLVTGSAATLASLKYGFAMFSIPAILPGALYLMYLDEPNTFVVGCSLFFFLIFILFIALRMHKTIFYSLKQQVEVSGKLSSLEVEKTELEIRVEKLQDKLKFEKNKMDQVLIEIQERQLAGTLNTRIGTFKDERFVTLLENLEGGVWDLEIQTGEMAFSDNWLNMLGYDKEDVSRKLQFWESILHPDDKLPVLNGLYAFIDGKEKEFSSSHRLKTKEGEWVWVIARAHGVILGSYGELLSLVGVEIYVPDSHQPSNKFLNIQNLDLNAWFLSKESFNDRMLHLIKTAGVDGIEHSLCHLKIIPKTEKHNQKGSIEEVFQNEVDRVLLHKFRQGDAILHLGNETFLILMEFCNGEDAWEKAFDLKDSLNSLQVDFQGRKYSATVAIGITPISNSFSTALEVMEDAEQACNLAINETSNQIYLFQKDNHEIGVNLFEKHIAKRIGECITNNEIGVLATPLRALSASTSKKNLFAVKFKVKEKANENFPGADYSAIARKNFLSPALDTTIIQNLFRWLQSSEEDSHKNGIYLYECSDISWLDEGFMGFLIEELEAHQEINGSLCIGISESFYMERPEIMGSIIEEVKNAGGKVALMDVGSTPMTVKMLQEYKVDFLKIDKSLMQNLEENNANYITVRYINDISHLEGMKSIVDEVNDESLLEILNTMNIDYIQESANSCPEKVIK